MSAPPENPSWLTKVVAPNAIESPKAMPRPFLNQPPASPKANISPVTTIAASDAFGTVERALAEDFERVAPDGSIDSRQSILDSVRAAYGTYDSGAFEIEIRNVEPVETSEDRALVRYEEWQTAPSGTNGRVSTALFAPASGSGEQPVAWRYLQETWLESTD